GWLHYKAPFIERRLVMEPPEVKCDGGKFLIITAARQRRGKADEGVTHGGVRNPPQRVNEGIRVVAIGNVTEIRIVLRESLDEIQLGAQPALSTRPAR